MLREVRGSSRPDKERPVRHLLLMAALFVCTLAGCASSESHADWGEFWKEARGDNMKMRSDFGTNNDNKDMGGSLKPSYF
jgi:hypothetical protein